MNEKPLYNIYSSYLKNKYGVKVYKLPVHIPSTCPNRDGTLGVGGCTFCSEKGAGFEAMPSTVQIQEQLKRMKEKIESKYKAKKFIAYFQNYTNTYMPIKQFEQYMYSACQPYIVELDIATRPDSIDDAYLDILKKIKESKGVEIVVELGLQTTNDESLKKVNRGHDVATFQSAVQRIHDYGFQVCTHLIMNLPWDEDSEVERMAELMNTLGVEMVKCHALYIAKETVMAHQYQAGEFAIGTMEAYIERTARFLSYLNSDITVQRLVSRAPEEDTIFCNWGTSWWIIKDRILEKMLKDGNYQGRMLESTP